MDDEKKTKENSQEENSEQKENKDGPIPGARYAVKIVSNGMEFYGYANDCQKLVKVAMRLRNVIPVIEEKIKKEK